MKPIVYLEKHCASCSRLREWLNQNNIEYEERDAEEHIEELRMKGIKYLPVVEMNGNIVQGFNEAKIKKLLDITQQ